MLLNEKIVSFTSRSSYHSVSMLWKLATKSGDIFINEGMVTTDFSHPNIYKQFEYMR